MTASLRSCLCAETGHIDPVIIERYNTPGFIGCLSRVEFNGIAPLKSALRTAVKSQATPTEKQPAAASPASYQGKLVESNCGASPLTIPPMSAATDPWHLDKTGEWNMLNRLIFHFSHWTVNADVLVLGGKGELIAPSFSSQQSKSSLSILEMLV